MDQVTRNGSYATVTRTFGALGTGRRWSAPAPWRGRRAAVLDTLAGQVPR